MEVREKSCGNTLRRSDDNIASKHCSGHHKAKEEECDQRSPGK